MMTYAVQTAPDRDWLECTLVIYEMYEKDANAGLRKFKNGKMIFERKSKKATHEANHSSL